MLRGLPSWAKLALGSSELWFRSSVALVRFTWASCWSLSELGASSYVPSARVVGSTWNAHAWVVVMITIYSFPPYIVVVQQNSSWVGDHFLFKFLGNHLQSRKQYYLVHNVKVDPFTNSLCHTQVRPALKPAEALHGKDYKEDDKNSPYSKC